MKKDDCIFCKIAAGEIPCSKVFEDDTTLAFMDIAPLGKGHVLVIPKNHFDNILEIDEETYGRLFSVICRIAKAVGASISPDGMTVMQLNGKASDQVVPHLHIHIVPRWTGDGLRISAWESVSGDMKDISRNAESIKSNLSR
jgi:histidine triad (HIT) family protein